MSKTYSKVMVQAPSGWTLAFEHIADPTYRQYPPLYIDDPDQPKFLRHGVFANNCTNYTSVHSIELRSHYNGGGANAFGGAKRWPVIEVKVAFKQNEYALAADFAKEIGEVIDRWMQEHGR